MRRYGAIKDLLWYVLAVLLLAMGLGLFVRYMDGRLILGAISVVAGMSVLIWNTFKN